MKNPENRKIEVSTEVLSPLGPESVSGLVNRADIFSIEALAGVLNESKSSYEQRAEEYSQKFDALMIKITQASNENIPDIVSLARRYHDELLAFDDDLSMQGQTRLVGYNENGEELYADEMFDNDRPEMTPEYRTLEAIAHDLQYIIDSLEQSLPNLSSLQTHFNVETYRPLAVEL